MVHPHDPVAILEAAGCQIVFNSANAAPMRNRDFSAMTNFENGQYPDECDIDLGCGSTPEAAAWDGLWELATIDFEERRIV